MTDARKSADQKKPARQGRQGQGQGRRSGRQNRRRPLGHRGHRRLGSQPSRARRHHPHGRQLGRQRDRRLAHQRADHRPGEVHRLHALLLLLPRRLDRDRERHGHGRRPRPLQGLRHLRRRVPRGRHHHERRGEGVAVATVAPILAVTGNEAVAEAMRQINPDVVAAYPITPQTEIVPDLRPVRGRRQGRHRVHHRRKRALGDERRHRLRRRRRPHHDGHELAGPGPHVGAPARGLGLPPAHRHGQRQPRPVGPHQHPLRPLRLHGLARHGLDPALRRGPPGGLRQSPHGGAHRRAPRRAHARHDHDRRFHRERRHRPAAGARDRAGAGVHRALQGHQPDARHGAPGHGGPVRRPAWLVLRAQVGPAASPWTGRSRWSPRSTASTPPSRAAATTCSTPTAWTTPSTPSSWSAPRPAPRAWWSTSCAPRASRPA